MIHIQAFIVEIVESAVILYLYTRRWPYPETTLDKQRDNKKVSQKERIFFLILSSKTQANISTKVTQIIPNFYIIRYK